ncbi:MAG: F0F1 ATP synthase subunit epsilon [Isosphaeraceae bacterium]
MSLQLETLASDRVLVQDRVISLQAAVASGQFGLRTGHEDVMTVLVLCVVRYQLEPRDERFAAVDGGVLLLERGRISIATRDAVVSERINQVADAATAMLEASRRRNTRRDRGSPRSRRPFYTS